MSPRKGKKVRAPYAAANRDWFATPRFPDMTYFPDTKRILFVG